MKVPPEVPQIELMTTSRLEELQRNMNLKATMKNNLENSKYMIENSESMTRLDRLKKLENHDRLKKVELESELTKPLLQALLRDPSIQVERMA